MGTGTCIALIVIGAILRFAIATGSSHGLNVHAVGVILILAGVLGLVLSLLVWGPLSPARRRRSRAVGYDRATSVVEERRVYQEHPPVAEEGRVWQEGPP
jgi:uncharacterized protein DUF6458